MLMEGIVWLIFAGPAIAIYIYFLSHTLSSIIPTGICILAVTFVISLLFTPAWLYAALGTDLIGSFKRAFNLFKRKHIQFLGLYILFSAAWLLNFVPIIDLAIHLHHLPDPLYGHDHHDGRHYQERRGGLNVPRIRMRPGQEEGHD